MFSKKIRSALLFAMISLLPIINCSSPVSSTGDVMFVSLPEQAVFFRQGSGPLAKSVAVKIDPIAIRVLSVFHKPVIHEDNYGMHPMPKTASSSFWDSTSGHRRNRWEDWVEYFLSDTVEEIIYQGVLERSGDFAKGKVAVKKGGYTSVAVGFIMPGDTLFSSNRYSAGPYWASYVWNDTISKWTYPTYGNGDTLAFEQYPPAAPAGLTADTSEGVLSLAWKPVKGATNYYICYTKGNSVDTSGYYFSTSKPYYIAPSLSLITDSTYTFAVRAGNSAGRSSFSAPVTAVVPRPTVPKTPANLSAKADSGR
nr:fibronectin type III domain-containing protein [Chitinispirillaceae bacterium]